MALIDDLAGVSGKLVDLQWDNIFFKSYESKMGFFYRAAAVVTAPIIFTAASAFFALMAAAELAITIYNLFTFNFQNVAPHANEFQDNLLSAGFCAVAIVFSPFVNLIDLIGGGVNSLLPETSPYILN